MVVGRKGRRDNIRTLALLLLLLVSTTKLPTTATVLLFLF